MSKMSRDKGARGEREVVNLACDTGLRAIRTAQLQTNRATGAADILLMDFPGLHVEVKRDERMSVDAMVRQAVRDATGGQWPVVVWRRNKGKWRADVPLEYLFELLAVNLRPVAGIEVPS